MGYELNQLMKLYGVSTPSANTYSGASKPTDFADENFELKMKNYDTDTAAYKKYQGDYDSRLAGASIYDLPQFQPKAATTTGTTGLTGLANQTMAQPVLTNPVYTNNPAYYKDLVMDRYKSVLNTAAPDAKGLAYWSQQLASGALNPSKFDTALLEGSKVKTDTTTGTTTGTTGTDTGTNTNTNTNTNTTIGGTNTNTNTNTGATTGGGLTDIAKTYTQMYGDQNLYTDQSGNQYRYDSESGQYNPYTNGGVEFSHGGSVKGYSRGGPEDRQSMGDQGNLLTLADIYGLENPTDLPYIEMPVQVASAPTTVVSDAPKVTTRAEPIRPTVVSPPDDGPQMSAEQILENMNRRSAVTAAQPPVQSGSPAPAPDAAGEGAVVPRPAGRPSLEDLYKRYAGTGTDYSGKIQAASEKARADTEAFKALLEKSMVSEKDSAPSKAEMYFRLAAAFGAPSKTGNIFENVSMAAKELGEFSKDTTAAKRAAKARNLELMMKGQDLAMRTSKEELDTLRGLSAEENKDRRQFVKDSISEYIKSQEPQSTAGKQARDEGLSPGTPEYQKRVNELAQTSVDARLAQVNATVTGMARQDEAAKLQREKFEAAKEKEKKAEATLTPKEVDMKAESEEVLAQTDQAISSLQRAYNLNPNTFDTSVGDIISRKILENTLKDDPKVIATREMENLLSRGALEKLKATFGAAPTEGERKILLDLEGIGAKSRAERDRIMLASFDALRKRREREAQRLKDITSGKYREKTQEPKPEGGE